MIILIPMGGKGIRFSKAGYTVNKASIPTTDRHSGKKLPMIVCAMKDIPGIDNLKNQIICVDRYFHKTNGTEEKILDFFPNTTFIHDYVMLDQAFACFLARRFLQSDKELFIGSCDSGMLLNEQAFKKACTEADALMISHQNKNSIDYDPLAHSWARLKKTDGKELLSISIKQTVSDNPEKDHATTGMFWFKQANTFLKYLEEMIWKQDKLEGKYYVDKVLWYCINAGLRVKYFDVKYIGWGTPWEYENYEKTLEYWKTFSKKEKIIYTKDPLFFNNSHRKIP